MARRAAMLTTGRLAAPRESFSGGPVTFWQQFLHNPERSDSGIMRRISTIVSGRMAMIGAVLARLNSLAPG
jgi:hypothetical protein